MNIDHQIRTLAERQHRVISRQQARALGLTPSALRHRLDGTDWERRSPQVLRLVGSPPTARQRAMAAVLDAGPGAVLSHILAAAMVGLAWLRPR